MLRRNFGVDNKLRPTPTVRSSERGENLTVLERRDNFPEIVEEEVGQNEYLEEIIEPDDDRVHLIHTKYRIGCDATLLLTIDDEGRGGRRMEGKSLQCSTRIFKRRKSRRCFDAQPRC